MKLVSVLCVWGLFGNLPGEKVETAVVTGTVTLVGQIPGSITYRTKGLPHVEALYPDGVEHHPVVADGQKNVKHAFVYIKSGVKERVEGGVLPAKHISIEKHRVAPRILGLTVGQKLIVTNRNETLHAAHALPMDPANREFNTGLPDQGMAVIASFDKPEMGIKLQTEVHHDWEVCWINVLPHGFYRVTNNKGQYRIPDLPSGRYTIEVWQENCVPVTKEVTLRGGKPQKLDFQLQVKKSVPE